tara:strand:+ start:507 stop:701 length:195 start_codon:yes stop_codon:yes gene_type:complete
MIRQTVERLILVISHAKQYATKDIATKVNEHLSANGEIRDPIITFTKAQYCLLTPPSIKAVVFR